MADGRRPRLAPVVLVLALGLSGCAVAPAEDAAVAKAELFTEMVKRAGLAEGMTPELAEHLYGPDGGALCGALDSSAEYSGIAWARTRVPQLPADHVGNLVGYDRSVVTVYCPQRLGQFDRLLADYGFTRS